VKNPTLYLDRLFKFNRPVGVVEELLPASVAVVVQVDVDEGIVPWLGWLFNKLHSCGFWSSTSFSDVALGTGADYIVPGCFAAHTPRDDMVER
jgi:hypothetical protein